MARKYQADQSKLAAHEAGNQRGESQRVAAGEIRGVEPMGRNEGVRLKRRGDLGEQIGMEVAKSFAYILLKNNQFAVTWA